jgi:hypothetical protein
MTLKCTADGRAEGPNHSIYACHHCGKPVCEQHGWVVSADSAFDDSAEDPGRRVPQPALQSAKRVPQPAMHCKQCVDEHHPRASKHLGWVEPREAQRAAAQARAVEQAQAAQQQAGGQPGRQYGPPPGQYPPAQYPPPQNPPPQYQRPPQQPPQQQPPQQQGQQWRQANGRP